VSPGCKPRNPAPAPDRSHWTPHRPRPRPPSPGEQKNCLAQRDNGAWPRFGRATSHAVSSRHPHPESLALPVHIASPRQSALSTQTIPPSAPKIWRDRSISNLLADTQTVTYPPNGISPVASIPCSRSCRPVVRFSPSRRYNQTSDSSALRWACRPSAREGPSDPHSRRDPGRHAHGQCRRSTSRFPHPRQGVRSGFVPQNRAWLRFAG
jgi:hypothetical protein